MPRMKERNPIGMLIRLSGRLILFLIALALITVGAYLINPAYAFIAAGGIILYDIRD